MIVTMTEDVNGTKYIHATDEDICMTCKKSWTDECPKKDCWEHNYQHYVKECDK